MYILPKTLITANYFLHTNFITFHAYYKNSHLITRTHFYIHFCEYVDTCTLCTCHMYSIHHISNSSRPRIFCFRPSSRTSVNRVSTVNNCDKQKHVDSCGMLVQTTEILLYHVRWTYDYVGSLQLTKSIYIAHFKYATKV